MNFVKLIFISILSITASVVEGQLTEENYKIYSVKTGTEVTLSDIADDMSGYDVLFFGEEHNDSVAHYLQIKLLEALYDKYSDEVTLSLEMFDRDVQLVMNEYLLGHIRETHFTRDARVWRNYNDYRPMVEYAKENRLDVICANSPGRYSNLVSREGVTALMMLPDESKRYFAPLPFDTASGKYYDKLFAIFGDMSSSAHTPAGFNLYLGQSLWDATMAYSIFEYLQSHMNKKIFHINGRFHSDEGFGVVTQLENYIPNIKCLVISSGSHESFPNINWQDFLHLGDYVIITDPNVPKTY